MIDLGTLASGSVSYGYGINGSGQLTGYATAGGSYLAFLYSGTPGVDGRMIDLGTLGGEDSFGYAINDKGQVAGSSDRADGQHHAFLYSGVPGADGHMYDLGTITGQFSKALGINNRGDVVGYGTRPVTGQGAFLYTGTTGVDGHMIDLDAWLDANNPVEGAKWRLVAAAGINDSGFITGEGLYKTGGTTVDRQSSISSRRQRPDPRAAEPGPLDLVRRCTGTT